jgi:hypothetical protein
MYRQLCLYHAGCVLNRLNYIMVPRAAAEVAIQCMADLFFCWMRIVLQQASGRHDHARRTKTALQSVAFFKPFLQGVQFVVGGKSFDGGYFTTIGLNRQQRTTFGGFAIHEYGAGAATAGIAANMGAC